MLRFQLRFPLSFGIAYHRHKQFISVCDFMILDYGKDEIDSLETNNIWSNELINYQIEHFNSYYNVYDVLVCVCVSRIRLYIRLGVDTFDILFYL